MAERDSEMLQYRYYNKLRLRNVLKLPASGLLVPIAVVSLAMTLFSSASRSGFTYNSTGHRTQGHPDDDPDSQS